MRKYIFVTGGVCSSLGKGIAASSLGSLLESRGLSVCMIKIDPYRVILARVPKALQDTSIGLITAGMIALIFTVFRGMV